MLRSKSASAIRLRFAQPIRSAAGRISAARRALVPLTSESAAGWRLARSSGPLALAGVMALLGCSTEFQVLTDVDRTSVGPVRDSGAVEARFSATDLAAGQQHSCAVVSGAVLCWGNNGQGELGTGDLDARRVPTQVGADEDWLQVAAGQDASCARRIDGSVWCWGRNELGEVGQPVLEPQLEPLQVSGISDTASLSMKFQVACVIRNDRSLWCWGDDYEGQLGQDDPFNPDGQPTPEPVQLGEHADWIQVDTGQGHVCGIRASGQLWCWGRNSKGELGLGEGAYEQWRTPQRVSEESDWIKVSAGQSSTCGLRVNGTLWCWGVNDGGLGLGEGPEAVYTPTQVGASHNWTQVSINTFGGCGIQAGSLWCWGRNEEGQLGVGDTEPRLQPVQVGSASDWIDVSTGRFHMCARRADGSLWCTGENDEARPLGVGDLRRRSELTPVVTPSALPR